MVATVLRAIKYLVCKNLTMLCNRGNCLGEDNWFKVTQIIGRRLKHRSSHFLLQQTEVHSGPVQTEDTGMGVQKSVKKRKLGACGSSCNPSYVRG
jgi:hypothetical protein